MVPQADPRTPVRLQRVRTISEAPNTLESTLESEDVALVVIEPSEQPRNWAAIDALADKIGESEYRVVAPGNASSSNEGQVVTFSAQRAQELSESAAAFRKLAMVTLADPDLDAKLFPDKHPYGSGSLRSEEGSTSIMRYASNRLFSLDSSFRRSAVWSFWMLDRLIKNQLYIKE